MTVQPSLVPVSSIGARNCCVRPDGVVFLVTDLDPATHGFAAGEVVAVSPANGHVHNFPPTEQVFAAEYEMKLS